MVLPEEALQDVPSDEEDEEAHGHAHQHPKPLDPEKQKALRLRHTQMETGRKKLIKELYVPRHPHLYTLTPEVRHSGATHLPNLGAARIHSVIYRSS